MTTGRITDGRMTDRLWQTTRIWPFKRAAYQQKFAQNWRELNRFMQYFSSTRTMQRVFMVPPRPPPRAKPTSYNFDPMAKIFWPNSHHKWMNELSSRIFHRLVCFRSGPSLVGGTLALCQGPRASNGPRASAADCCKRRNNAPCMIFHCFLEQLAVIWSVDSEENH